MPPPVPPQRVGCHRTWMDKMLYRALPFVHYQRCDAWHIKWDVFPIKRRRRRNGAHSQFEIAVLDSLRQAWARMFQQWLLD